MIESVFAAQILILKQLLISVTCDLHIRTHRNEQLVNLETKKNPVLIGPVMVPFRKDVDAITRFSLELLHANKQT